MFACEKEKKGKGRVGEKEWCGCACMCVERGGEIVHLPIAAHTLGN